jgi:hypothetical protein
MMPSSTYRLLAEAIAQRKQVLCVYEGFARAVCPIMLGHKRGQERVLSYQFAGSASRGLPPGGQWKCLDLSKMDAVELRAGPWHDGARHSMPQHCIDDVDIDINPDSPYTPRTPSPRPKLPTVRRKPKC